MAGTGPDGEPPRDPDAIRSMFNDVAPAYDRLNRFMSLGLDARWRRRLLDETPLAAGGWVLDLGTGTGDLAVAAARRVPEGLVVGVDLAETMLSRAREKARTLDPGEGAPVRLVQGTALDLPVPDDWADAAISAFTLRNVRDRAAFARETRRVLRPGGSLAVLEAYVPKEGVLGRLAGPYFHGLVSRLAGRVSGEPEAYRYLSRSVRTFPPRDRVTALLREAGFEDVASRGYLGGLVGAHHARAP